MREFNITVDGKSYQVEVEEVGVNTTSVVQAIAAPVAAKPQVKAPTNGTELKSPMPGTIMKFLVPNGSKVAKNQDILVLEAMKMENNIPANADGIVTFTVAEGASVNTGDVLAVIA